MPQDQPHLYFSDSDFSEGAHEDRPDISVPKSGRDNKPLRLFWW